MSGRVDVDVSLRADEWQDVRGDRACLKATLWLNGTPLHLEAVQVLEDPTTTMLHAAVAEDEDRLEGLDRLYETRWQTMPLRWSGEEGEREYVVYAVPYGD
jgi:hypothetical protein